MGQKINPISFRLGISKTWTSRWFDRKKYQQFLEEDHALRQYIEQKLNRAAIESIHITRPGNEVVITLRTARPGLVIGRGGKSLEELQAGIVRELLKIARRRGEKLATPLKIEIEEIRKPEQYARLVAKNIAEQLERRLPFRRTMKQVVEKVMQQKEVEGVKIALAGRLGGANIARVEHVLRGKVPLQTLRADIDYAHVNARTTYGVIGVKVWIYRGEVFDEEKKNDKLT